MSYNVHPDIMVKGFILPKRGSKPTYSRIFTGDVRKKLYIQFREFLKVSLKYFTEKKNRKISSSRDLMELYDLMILLIRNTSYKSIQGNKIPSASTVYIGWFIKKISEEEDSYPLYSAKELDRLKEEGVIEGLYEEYLHINEEFENSQVGPLTDFIADLLEYPADSRVGGNTSSLILHTIITSGLSQVIYLSSSNNINDRDIAFLRSLSMFHDVGKLLRIRGHEALSADFIDRYIVDEEYVEKDSEAYDILKNVSRALRSKADLEDDLSRLYEIFKKADRFSAGIDRLKHLVLNLLDDEDKEILSSHIKKYLGKDEPIEKIWSKVYNNMDFWDSLIKNHEVYIKLTEDFCRNASSMEKTPEFVEKLRKESLNNVCVARLDIRGIQSFIRSSDIRSMVGGSFLVDLAIFGAIPEYIREEFNLGLDTILVNGGGNLTILLPDKICMNKMMEFSNAFYNSFKIRLNIASTTLASDIWKVDDILNNNLLKNKLTNRLSYESVSISPSLTRRCDFCGDEGAVLFDRNREVYICEKCKLKYDIGDKMHFITKLRRLSESSIEYISRRKEKGEAIDFLKDIAEGDLDGVYSPSESMNMAVVKFDGNLIGQLMSSSISLTDLFERSIRIDSSVKDAVNKFLESIINIDNKQTYNAILLGTMYIGGDDALIIMPSYIAPVFSLFLLNEYYLNMGGKSSLSLSIISAKYKHPIHHLYLSSSRLLDDFTKGSLNKEHEVENTRSIVWRTQHSGIVDDYSDEYRGSISFFTLDVGIITREVLEPYLKSIYEDRLSILYLTPYLLSKYDDFRSIFRLTSMIFSRMKNVEIKDFSDLDIDKIKEVAENIIVNIRDMQKGMEGFKDLKDLKNSILKSLSWRIAGETDEKIRIMAMSRESSKRSEDNSGLYMNEVKNIITSKPRLGLNAADLLLLIKILGGGLSGL